MKNKILYTTILLVFYLPLLAVLPPKARYSYNPALKDDKFMVGLKGGLTIVHPLVLQKFNVLSPIDNSITSSGMKTYNSLVQNIGYQYAFTALYKLNNTLDIRLEPNFTTYVYKYHTDYSWESNGTNTERIDMSIKHNQSLKYIEIPVTLRYLYGTGKVRPFIQGGFFYGFLLSAIKSANREETYTNSSGVSTISQILNQVMPPLFM